MKSYQASFQSPIGTILITTTDEGINHVSFSNEQKIEKNQNHHPFLIECVKQFEEYFNLERKIFSLTLKLEGTEFQKSVWRTLLKIPYGQIRTYGQIAKILGKPEAARAT